MMNCLQEDALMDERQFFEKNQQDHPIGPEHFVSLCDTAAGTNVAQATLDGWLATPPIIMHAGAYFGIRDTKFENAYTKHSLVEHVRPADIQGIEHYPEADMEARALASMYRLHGHPVTYMLPQSGSADGIFSTDSDKTFQKAEQQADGSWTMGQVVSLLPVFTHQERQIEAPWKERLLRTTHGNPNKSAHRIICHMTNPMEFGDTRIAFHKTAGKSTGFILAGIAESNEIALGRSTTAGHRQFEGFVQEHVSKDIEVVTIHLKQPFYHMDTSGPNCTGGHMFTHRSAYAPESWDVLQQIFGDKLVELPLEDIGHAFGGNATCFGSRVYISDALSDTAMAMIAERGYDVTLTPIRYTMKGGGGHRCMTAVNPHIYVPGGYDLGHDESRTGSISRVVVDYQTGGMLLEQRNSSGAWESVQELDGLVTEHDEIRLERMSVV
jgi:N-dimethylarginine dimethylaminohydrolase